ncbi:MULTISPECIES: SPOR domain-containing protein [Microbacterium]|uniref:SPOR domain-containing protein n=1 Tax=Microbacterium TaxID=33882 RepID=UPI00300F9BF7
MEDADKKYWYNIRTGDVEFGMISPAVDRVGPFDTEEEARRAPEKLEENARVWAEEDAADDSWGGSGPDDAKA